jgi:glycosyltransferase involved in cell wall biosynthesis
MQLQKISIVLASYNGQNVLPKTLDAFCLLEETKCDVEFIIVDNSSSDNTAQIIKHYGEKLPICYLYEERQGKAFALHKGIEKAKGDLVIFTDDDVVPSPNWLVEYENAANNQTDYAIFVGQIRPYWLASPPQWLIKLTEEGRSCGCTRADLVEGNVSFHIAKGANMAVRKDVLQKVRFREDLWVAGKVTVGGEDTDFICKASQMGYKIWYSPHILLQHIVRPDEMTIISVYKRYFRIGRSNAAVFPSENEQCKQLFGYPRWLLVKLLKQFLSAVKSLIMMKSYEAVCELIEIAEVFGKAYQNKRDCD